MPLPSIDETTEGSLPVEATPSLEFTYVESLMFAFHQLARQHKEFLSENAERCKDFRARYLKIFFIIIIFLCKVNFKLSIRIISANFVS